MARVALVTGGTRGIGEAISIALKDAGYEVAANYGGNDEAASRFKEKTGIPVYKWDVSDFQACQDGIAKVEGDLGPVEVLVNNAGITRDTTLHRMKPEQWSDVIRTNLDSLFNMTRGVIEDMRERGFGRIVNISSINGQKGQFGQSNYSAAKAGLIGFTKAIAQENAAKGITVNAVAPGYIGTEMVRAVPEDVLKSKILPLIPVGRLGEPEEVARCVVFLASDDAGFITGSTLSANGGQYMA
jgi:acetoacetyl-CoA reductase